MLSLSNLVVFVSSGIVKVPILFPTVTAQSDIFTANIPSFVFPQYIILLTIH
jgi:hypothetical protein